jgi:ribonuclease BN (tRNA processing enzyme)
VTFSGDTTKSDNLITPPKTRTFSCTRRNSSLDDAYYHNKFPPNYLVNSHTSARQVGEVAAAARSSLCDPL